MCRSFAQQDRLDPDTRVLRLSRFISRQLNLAEIVECPRYREHVEGAESTLWSRALRVVMVAVDGEDGNGDIQVGVFIVDSREAAKKLASATPSTHEKPGVAPSYGSLSSSNGTGLSPSVYSLSSAMTWCMHVLDGRFS